MNRILSVSVCGLLFLNDPRARGAESAADENTPFPEGSLKTSSRESLDILDNLERNSLKNLFDPKDHIVYPGAYPSIFDSLDSVPVRTLFYRESKSRIDDYEYQEADLRSLTETQIVELSLAQKRLIFKPASDFDKSVSAFLGAGDLSRVKLFGHHWTIKAANFSVLGNRVIMDGVLIHNDRLSFGHEVYFEVRFLNGKAKFEVNTGERTNYIGFLIKPLSLAIKFLLLRNGQLKARKFDREIELLGRTHIRGRRSILNTLSQEEQLRDIDTDYDQDLRYLNLQKATYSKRVYVELVADVLEGVVSDVGKYNQESFKKVADWEKQAHKLVKRLAYTAWERVSLSGLKFDQLPRLFKKSA